MTYCLRKVKTKKKYPTNYYSILSYLFLLDLTTTGNSICVR